MSDIVWRLRSTAEIAKKLGIIDRLSATAADEIDRLCDENKKLRAALKPFAELKPVSWSLENDHYFIDTDDIRAAAAALKETGNG